MRPTLYYVKQNAISASVIETLLAREREQGLTVVARCNLNRIPLIGVSLQERPLLRVSLAWPQVGIEVM
jgi:hypothetical protein